MNERMTGKTVPLVLADGTEADAFVVDFPDFGGDTKDLPKADVMEVELFQDGSVVYKSDGLTTVELPSFAHEK